MRNFINRSLLRSLALLSVMWVFLTITQNAEAVPSYSRQTGMACSQCHTQSFGPNLTPMGRDFKLSGYTMGGGSGLAAELPRFSAVVEGSFTHTDKNQDNSGFQPGFNKNDNFTFDEAHLYYAGRLYNKIGTYSKLTYDGYNDAVLMDDADIRFADQAEFGENQITYGISLNNDPTVQDLWNTTPVWSFPYNSSGVQPGPTASAIIDGGLNLASQVGGATAYTMINDLLYLEAGAYDSFSDNFQRGFGYIDLLKLDGPASYWRVALQHMWHGHYFSIGHFGMNADVFPGGVAATSSDKYSDIAFDATYQYMGNPRHIFEVKTTYIYEDQKLSASKINDGVAGNNHLATYKLNTTYTFDQTYGITFSYNNTTGSQCSVYFPCSAGVMNRPNSEFFSAELVYVPFGKSSSYMKPWLNLRTSLQYIGYSQFDGTGSLANQFNTLLIHGTLAF